MQLVNLWFGDSFSEYYVDGCITDVRDFVEEHIDEVIGTERSGFLGDVVGNFLYEVNWNELVEHYVRETKMEEDYVHPGMEVAEVA